MQNLILYLINQLGYSPTQCMRCQNCLIAQEVQYMNHQNEKYEKLGEGFNCDKCQKENCIFISDYDKKGQSRQEAAKKFRYYTGYKGKIQTVSIDGQLD